MEAHLRIEDIQNKKTLPKYIILVRFHYITKIHLGTIMGEASWLAIKLIWQIMLNC
jgi:hypothetical protein